MSRFQTKGVVRHLTLGRLRAVTGSVIGIYVTMHLSNHALGLISIRAQELARPWVMAVWHSLPGQILLYGSLSLHALIGLSVLIRRRHGWMPVWEATQILLGLLIPYLLLVHIVNTRGTRILTGINIDYEYEIANLWVDPWTRFRQILLVLLVWGHFVVGLHFWLRIYRGYQHAFHVILLGYVLLPVMALLGFAEAGMDIAERARLHPEWMQMMKKRGVPADPNRAKVRAALKEWIGPSWLVLVGIVFSAALIRNQRQRRQRFAVTYPDGTVVVAPIGMSILEVSRMVGRPHMSVCGGRARCTTCRVRVNHTSGQLPPPDEIEARALARISAPDGLRLACQLKPAVNIAVEPLLHPSLTTFGSTHPSEEKSFGEERHVAILFLDVRGSTELAETRLPYDVVFLLNHFFAEMTEAVEGAGGHYSNFTGDGLMALFGLQTSPNKGARAALLCALRMLERLDRMNQRLAGELKAPLAIGIGIHSGEAIVGRMGPPKTPILSALGDTVNTTARLESMTKELHAPVVVSAEALKAAAVNVQTPLQKVSLRGRSMPLEIASFNIESLRQLLLAQP